MSDFEDKEPLKGPFEYAQVPPNENADLPIIEPPQIVVHNPPKADTSWVKWLIVAVAVVVVALIGLGAAVVLSNGDDGNDSSGSGAGVGTSLTEPDDATNEDAARTILDQIWIEMDYSEQQNICKYWNMGLDDVFMKSFMDNLDGSNEQIGISDSDMEVLVRDFFNGKC